ncbi:MAG: metallophosphoesterase [Candidatus Saccharibacteria bacterium]|nr:metallophosphoesterase [Candidatus Saccharibacteria bacterium]
MKEICLDTYKFRSNQKLKILVVSDIHFSYQVANEKFERFLKVAEQKKPDYILIPGDLIDSNDMIKDPDEEERLLGWLEQLGFIARVLISMGNHDSYEKAGKDWRIFRNKSFYEKVNLIRNVTLLDNDIYEDDKLYVLGLTLTPTYYNFNTSGENKTTFIRPTNERTDELLRIIRELKPKKFFKKVLRKSLTKDLPKDKLKLAMIHSPVCLHDSEVEEELKEFDYYISGHMHNGIVPPIFDEIFRGTRGIVSPTRNIFPPNIRHTIKGENDKSIVVGAFTTSHECAGWMHHFNVFFPTYAAMLEFSKNNSKIPEIKRKYLRPKL